MLIVNGRWESVCCTFYLGFLCQFEKFEHLRKVCIQLKIKTGNQNCIKVAPKEWCRSQNCKNKIPVYKSNILGIRNKCLRIQRLICLGGKLRDNHQTVWQPNKQKKTTSKFFHETEQNKNPYISFPLSSFTWFLRDNAF